MRLDVDDLIFRSLRQEASDLEERQLRRWRAASAENEAQYQRIAGLLALPVDAVGPPPGGLAPPPPLAAIIAEGDARRAAARRRMDWHRWRRFALPSAAAAALVAAAWGIGRLTGLGSRKGFAAAEFVTSHLQTVTATLTDGSLVRLGPDGRLRFDEAGPRREAWLQGMGFFAVAKNPSRPFVIHTTAGDTRIVGTRFELRARDNELRLVVVEGRVALRAGGSEIMVSAGEVSHVDHGLPPSVVKVDDIYGLLDWPSGLLVFQSTPLRQVASEFERHYRARIAITDSALAAQDVTAWFSDQTFIEALTTVCRVVRAHCVVKDSLATIAPRP